MSEFVERVLSSGAYQLAESDPHSNWDLYINDKGQCISKAKKAGCQSTFFGDVNHVAKLITQDHFNVNNLNEYGRKCLSGLYCRLIPSNDNCGFIKDMPCKFI